MEVMLQWPSKLVFITSMALLMVVMMMKVVVLLWWKPKKIESHFLKQGIKGPPYHFFIGNVKELVGMMLKASATPMPDFSHNILPRVLSFYHHWKKIYGTPFIVWFGPTVRVTVSDPDLIKEIFISKSELYEKNEAHPLIKQLEGDGLLSLKGQKWAHHRKIITPTFHMENLKLLVPVMTQRMTDMLDKWSAMSANGSRDVEIDVFEWFQTLTEDIITRTVFGTSYEDGKAIFCLQAQQMVLAAETFQKVFIPGYRKSLMKQIESRTSENRRGEDGAKDLLGLMIESSYPSPDMSVDDIIEECKSFFFAGKQTTSNLLTWTTVLLAMHPQWQVQARDEVLKLTIILNESLRLYPPTIATIRRAKSDVELGGYMIPRGTELLIPILAVHHDQTIWGNDANEFNPGRIFRRCGTCSKTPDRFHPVWSWGSDMHWTKLGRFTSQVSPFNYTSTVYLPIGPNLPTCSNSSHATLSTIWSPNHLSTSMIKGS
ncbi:hypothetical protein GOBAR_AA31960 [Gossypium barbadense]|uniref:Cytochrome P450 n=1 Tax=Gossypium barbadense TaxID=3634 RepID=A0A2P5WCA8_GOSBA|nr:hypothetical protein GOBAR_AA31960 [Gossypium barbadense]